MNVEKFAQVTQTGKGVYLNLENAKEVAGMPDFPGHLIRYLLMIPIENLDQEKVRDAVSNLSKDAWIAPAQEERIDGKFNLLTSPDGGEIQMSFIPPQPGGKIPQVSEVYAALEKLDGQDFKRDEELIQKILRAREKTSFTVIARRLDMQATLDINTDWTQASLMITQAFGGRELSLDDILGLLEIKGICHGVNKEMISDMVNGRMYNQPLLIARGEPTVEGQDAVVEYLFDIHQRKARPSLNEDNTVNMKELNLIDSVPIGTILARKTPPTEGKAGKDIRGKEVVVRNGKDYPLLVGRGADYNPNNPLEVIATMPGQPKLTGGRITINPVLEIRSDIDFGTGNINFMGDVKIMGNVINGFIVKASGDVEIFGVVESAQVEAGGNLMIKNGVVGGGEAVISTRQNLVAKYLDSAKVFVDGDLTVDESVLNCECNVIGQVRILGKKGGLIGGTLRAGRLVQVRQLGGPMGAPTRVEIGGAPKIFQELAEIEKLTQEIRRRSEEIEKTVALYKKEKDKEGDLSADNQKKFIQTTRTQFALISKLKAFKFQKDALRAQMEAMPGQRAALEVFGNCYSNITVVIRNAMTKVVHETKQVRFTEHDETIETAFLSAK